MKKKNIISFLVPFLIVSVISVLGIYSEIMIDIEYKLYDAALMFKPFAPESGNFLNVEVDDNTLDILDTYPLKRSTVADGLLVLQELGADYILLDTQMVDQTPKGINILKYNELPGIINQVKSNTFGTTEQLINAFSQGQLDLEDKDEYLEYLSGEYDDFFDGLTSEANQIALNYDDYISSTFRFMNSVYSTNDFENAKQLSEESIKYLQENQSLKNITIIDDNLINQGGYNPTIKPIMESTLGAGFVATVLDDDGATRRTDLIYEMDEHFYPQLAFKYYLDRVGNPDIEVYSNKIVLKNIIKEGMEPHDLVIPTNDKGQMTINWAGVEYNETFKKINFYILYQYNEAIRNLKTAMEKLLNNSLTNTYAVGLRYPSYINMFKMAEQIRLGGDPEEFADYVELRSQFIEAADIIFNGVDDSITLDVQFEQDVIATLDAYEITGDDAAPYFDAVEQIKLIFKDARETLQNVKDKRDHIKERAEGASAIFGYTATSTFDIGANPFENEYYNMGIYSTIANNLMAEEFIKETPMWLSISMAALFAFLASIIIKRNEAKQSIIWGLSLFLVIIMGFLLLFRFTGVYVYILIPGLSFIIVFIQKISGKLLATSRDKAFIKNAFGQYLSEDVIKDIIDDPTKLKLGGEEKEITAFFTDVKGFSTISEKLTPDELVSLLNEYLTAMSDIALANKGTIDKYEGDAIIGFFGAPAPLPDHATKAIEAAIRMKQVEEQLNKKFLETGMAPSPLQTRIGVNSGPCVVGNMGTPKKMDYTMMGNDVNIAARLEGVNKQYGTWILASERSMNLAEDIFLARRLDRVRVVGINNPIRLYNPIAIKSEATEDQLQLVNRFETALSLFEERDWEGAKTIFKSVLKIDPDDKPSIRYIQLCDKFREKQPESNWDGVFNLTSK